MRCALLSLGLLLAACRPGADPAPAHEPDKKRPARKVEWSEVIRRVAFSPNGKVLVAVYDSAEGEEAPPKPRTLAAWETATGKRLWTLPRSSSLKVTELAFFPDSKQLLVKSRQKLKVLDVATGKVGRTVLADARQVSCFAVLPDDAVSDLTFTPDGKRLLCASAPTRLVLRALPGGKPLRSVGVKPGVLPRGALSPEARYAVSVIGYACSDLEVHLRLWDGATGKPLRLLRGDRTDVDH
jgi:WD40 repeat protein